MKGIYWKKYVNFYVYFKFFKDGKFVQDNQVFYFVVVHIYLYPVSNHYRIKHDNNTQFNYFDTKIKIFNFSKYFDISRYYYL